MTEPSVTPQSSRAARTSVRSRLLGLATALLAAVLLAGCGGPAIPKPSASPTGSVREQLDEVLGTISGDDRFGLALHDLRTGAEYGFNADYASQSASMAKPMIVLMALRKARSEGGLSPENTERAQKAIIHSDNDSADALYAYAGGAEAYNALAADLKMTATHADETHPTSWSWTWTTPADQLTLIDALAKGSDAIPEDERAFLWDLMGKVEDDQAWGVGARRSGSVSVHVKNGWVQFQSSDGLWAVNSIGQVDGDGRSYELAMMTRRPDFDTGRETLNEAGRWVFDILGTGQVEQS